jgi:hypothetical protein
MKIIKFIGIIVCLWMNTSAWAVSYSPYYSKQASFVPPDAQYRSDNSSAAKAPQIAFSSTSTIPVSYNTVKALNTDGSVSMAYTTYGESCAPRRARKGLDLDDEDEPTGALVPIGDIPWAFILLLIFVFLRLRPSRT